MPDTKKGGNQGGRSQNRGGAERVQPDDKQRDSTQSGNQDKKQEGGEKQQGGKHGEQHTQGNPSRSEKRK